MAKKQFYPGNLEMERNDCEKTNRIPKNSNYIQVLAQHYHQP